MSTEQSNFEKLILDFEKAIESGQEQAVHNFFQDNDWILRFGTFDDSLVLSKFRLADKYIPDFTVIGMERLSRSPRPLITFIEIERSTEPLYTKSGDPTSFLTHAIQQAQDWKTWVEEKREYLITEFARITHERVPNKDMSSSMEQWNKYYREEFNEGIRYGFSDRYLVIAGRRTEMTISERIKLASTNENLHKIRVITYDCIVEDLIRSYEATRNYVWRYSFRPGKIPPWDES